MQPLIPMTNETISRLTSRREGETKLGQTVNLPDYDWERSIKISECQFIIFGIPEDIGPRANHGQGGSHNAWPAFLSKFLNMQDNQFISGQNMMILGEIDCKEEMQASQTDDVHTLRSLVEKIDEKVSRVCKAIVDEGKTPIAIGGGHNNSYGMLKGCSEAYNAPLNCINMDPHADFRPLEGRHSGNGFSYAKEHNYLNHYFVFGLHLPYNSRHILGQAPERFNYMCFETILHDYTHYDYSEILHKAMYSFSDEPCGLELDLDAIENIPTSAMTPTGFLSKEARQFIGFFAEQVPVAYLHLAEGAPKNDVEKAMVGKLLAYLVSDFIQFAPK